MIKAYLTVVFLVYVAKLCAQSDYFDAGSASLSLSGTSVASNDRWAGVSNPASIAFLKELSTGVYVENRFNIRQLDLCAAIFNFRLCKNAFLINFYSFNQSTLYSRQKYEITYALALGKSFSAGISLDLLKTGMEGYGTNLSYTGSTGIFYKPTDKINFGAAIFNPSMSKYSGSESEKIPTVMKIGTSCRLSSNTNVLFEIRNSTLSGYSFRGGIEYHFLDKLIIRFGQKTNPVSFSSGLTFMMKNFTVSVALQYQQVLDATPGVDFDYVFKKYESK